MLIVGKYFLENNDFVNIMKVSKKYHDLVSMYYFNPISDCSLFENMESQYLYEKEDIKRTEMYQYVYWYEVGCDIFWGKREIMKYIRMLN